MWQGPSRARAPSAAGEVEPCLSGKNSQGHIKLPYRRQIQKNTPLMFVICLISKPQPERRNRQTEALECGGRASRRHRFSRNGSLPKAAWRVASRRSPKPAAAQRAALLKQLGRFVFIRGFQFDTLPTEHLIRLRHLLPHLMRRRKSRRRGRQNHDAHRKIARLPRDVRNRLNCRLQDGEPASRWSSG